MYNGRSSGVCSYLTAKTLLRSSMTLLSFTCRSFRISLASTHSYSAYMVRETCLQNAIVTKYKYRLRLENHSHLCHPWLQTSSPAEPSAAGCCWSGCRAEDRNDLITKTSNCSFLQQRTHTYIMDEKSGSLNHSPLSPCWHSWQTI